jgi:hypothetical protein
MKEALRSSETTVPTRATRRVILEDVFPLFFYLYAHLVSIMLIIVSEDRL